MEHVVEFDGFSPLMGAHFCQPSGQCAEPATQEGLHNDLLKDENK